MRQSHCKWILFFLLPLLFSHCTFGSVGDSNKEKETILQNLIFFNNNQTVAVGTNLRSYDDQADDNLNQFSLTSNAVGYNITIQSSTYTNWETGTYRINPPNQVLGVSTSGSEKVLTQLQKHIPRIRCHSICQRTICMESLILF